MFKIGEFSRLCRVPSSVLRYYDALGIFKPERVDPFTGYRYYTLDQLPRLNRILALRDLDLSLAEIESIVNEQISVDEIKGMLRLKQAELSQQQAAVRARLRRVEVRLKQMESEHKMPEYEVVVKAAAAMKIASIRAIVPAVEQMPARCGAMFEAVAAWLATQQQRPHGPALAIYYDPEYVETNIDVENAFVVNDALADGAYPYGDYTITVRELPPIDQVASTIHRGDFDGLANGWQALARWLDQNGYATAGPPSREFYLSAPGELPVAEIQIPVKRQV